MRYRTFHEGSIESDPIMLITNREMQHCEQLGIPFLFVKNPDGDYTWGYLLSRDNVSVDLREATGDYVAQYFVFLVRQTPGIGTASSALVPYHADFKEWAAKLRYAALHWDRFPAEEFALA